MIKQKGKEWLKRYLPSEIIGTVTAMTATVICQQLSKNFVVIAYAGALGESIGFYSTILIQNILIEKKNHKNSAQPFSFHDLYLIVINIILEFGPAGIIDGLILRPFFMYVFPLLLKNFMLGIFVGKIVGDITFYFLVIISYEINKRRRANAKIIDKP
jgi:hypothetical protein